ncbi:hypothetical protein HYW32_03145 [Candidatus Berkelbacteria bacterium]|nr:hypothetical protein [Candidatus Berkelbacteria bacterium]
MPQPNWRERYRHPKIYRATPTYVQPVKIRLDPKLIGMSVGLILFSGLIWLILFSKLFMIQQIDIVGTVTPEVQTEITNLYGKNLLTYSSGGMERRLKEAQSSIREVQVYKGLPRTLRIEIAVRTPILAWRSGDTTYLLDEQGIAFQAGVGVAVDEQGKSLITVVDNFRQPIVLGKQLVRRQFITMAAELSRTFPVQFPLIIDRLEVGQTTFELVVVTNAGWKAYFDTTRDLEPQLESLKKIFENFHDAIKEYVDLRIVGRAYYK